MTIDHLITLLLLMGAIRQTTKQGLLPRVDVEIIVYMVFIDFLQCDLLYQ